MLTRLSAHKAGLLAVAVAALLWSTGGLFIKLLPFEPLTILFYRSACAALLFGLLFRNAIFRLNGLTIFVSIVYAALMMTFVFSTKLTTAANAIFLQYTAPIYVLLLEPLLFRLPLERINIWTIVVCFLGMVLFFLGDLEMGNTTGNVIALGSGVLLAAMMLGQRKNDPTRHEAAIFWGNVLVVLIAIPSYLQSATPQPLEWGMLLFLGFVQMGMGFFFFTYGLKRVLAIEGSLLGMLEPILNPVWVFIGYGETPSKLALVGGLLIIAMLSLRVVIKERTKYRQYKMMQSEEVQA
ncbi:MAG TPA: EamA family transporter [Saprospiraceae bacterium]|nr:EamA family transporter [Saprospiraceae bacterium]HMP14697.1 EamA family transporter [Saprospiraceae bacterium]